jgi:hypothetical protein
LNVKGVFAKIKASGKNSILKEIIDLNEVVKYAILECILSSYY